MALFCDIAQLPKLGEEFMVPNSETWEMEKLTAVKLEEDAEMSESVGTRILHVYFASPEDADNVHTTKDGVKFYSIKTYA